MAFKGKLVLITGAASGIGAATALKFATAGAKLALVDKDENTLTDTAQTCKENTKDAEILTVFADLSTDDILTVIPKTIKRFGRLDVLVNGAGIMSEERMTDDDVSSNFDKVIGINLKAPVILTNKATPYLIETKGCIVNIGSMRASRPCDKRSMYCVSKAGLEMFTKCVALDLADKGVRVNCVNPGVVRTRLQLSYNPAANMADHYMKSSEKYPFGVIEPGEVANVVLFLADGDMAGSVTGAGWGIDGGLSLMETKSAAGKF